jgi:hypothetical protein
MPPSLTPGSSIVVSVQCTDVDIGLRHGPKDSALPMFPQSVSRGARFSGLLWFTTATACQVAGPPCTDLTGFPANGGFYFQAFSESVILLAAGYDYNSNWTPLLAGLSPAGMAASLAALVRPCVARKFRRTGDWRSCINVSGLSLEAGAPGHYGYQRACDLINVQASTGPTGPPVFARTGKTDPPSRLILSQTSSAGKSDRSDYVIAGSSFCAAAVIGGGE